MKAEGADLTLKANLSLSRSAFSNYVYGVPSSFLVSNSAFGLVSNRQGIAVMTCFGRMMMGMRTAAQERSENDCIITRGVHISRMLCIYLINEVYD